MSETIRKIRSLYDELAAFPMGMDAAWEVKADRGKPLLYGRNLGPIAYGTIATWKEYELIVAVINALPEILGKLASLKEEDIDEIAYEKADAFSDWYGCDHLKRQRLTEAFAQSIAVERERCAGIADRRAAVLRKIAGYHSEVTELQTLAITIRGGATIAESGDAQS
jgi:hypothetical protein